MVSRKGNIVFSGPFGGGIFRIGLYPSRVIGYNTPEVTRVAINGEMIVGGRLFVGNGSVLEIEPSGKMTTGHDVLFQSRNKIYVEERFEVGDHVNVSWETQFFDTDFHYVENMESHTVRKRCKPIRIGSHVWIGNRCTIQKGSVIPDDSTIASNSLVNKDLSDNPRYSIYAGMPAKKVKTGYERVFNYSQEVYLDKQFENPEVTEVTMKD